jgi:signal transduction histidine kinase
MVNDLLDINRLETGEMPLVREELFAASIAGEAVGTVATLAAEMEVRLTLTDVDPELRLDADREILCRVLVNLLGNAIKFTPAGGAVTLSVSRDQETVAFSVTDTGEGIAAEHLARIFDKFYQAHSRAQGRQVPSSGLGLTFCRLAVEAHGGRIDAESAPGRGSRFWFTLPAPTAPQAAPAASADGSAARARPAPNRPTRSALHG